MQLLLQCICFRSPVSQSMNSYMELFTIIYYYFCNCRFKYFHHFYYFLARKDSATSVQIW